MNDNRDSAALRHFGSRARRPTQQDIHNRHAGAGDHKRLRQQAPTQYNLQFGQQHEQNLREKFVENPYSVSLNLDNTSYINANRARFASLDRA